MKLRTILATSLLLASTFGVVHAEGDLREQRKATMKANGAAIGALVKIAKGQSAYDAAVVAASLKAIQEDSMKFPGLFPSADAVEDPAASPKIWEDKADFTARAEKLAAEAGKLLAELPADQAGVGAALGVLGPNCGGCHEIYRIEQK